MDHNISLISTLAAAFGIALVLGFIAVRLKLPALVGYLVAGILIGPATPGFVADLHIAAQLSEIGVMLLMFGVGLHFSLGDLLSVKRIAVPGAVVQMSCATLLGAGLAAWWGWPWGEGLLFGLTLSCASTVVLLKALEARGVLDSMNGRIAVGWLVVEDLATVLVLVLLPPLAGLLGGTPAAASGTQAVWITVAKTLLEVAAFIGLMMVIGRKLIPWLLWQIAGTGSRELFTLSIVAAAIGIAVGAAELFSVSFALGAFFAGMVMRESQFSHRAAEESLPLRDAFSVLFFVAVGMLFEPAILFDQPLQVLAVISIIMFGKTIAAGAIVLAFRYPLNTALTVAASLAQIGEFSFILAGLGQSLGLLSRQGMSLILAGALFSIAFNPLIFSLIEPLRRWALKRSTWARQLEQRSDPLAELPQDTARRYLEKQVILVGYGKIGQRIAADLTANGIPFVVAEQNRELVETLRRSGIPAVSGDAGEADVLIQAHVAHAAVLVVATADPIDIRHMVSTARSLNPGIAIVLRTQSAGEAVLWREAALGTVFLGEEELAGGMSRHVLSHLQA